MSHERKKLLNALRFANDLLPFTSLTLFGLHLRDVIVEVGHFSPVSFENCTEYKRNKKIIYFLEPCIRKNFELH